MKGRRYFSQNGEDYLLWNLFDYGETGFYVDIGAFDGIYLSNTYSFELQGWAGICVEPHPEYFRLCKSARSGSICLNAACIADDGADVTQFYVERMGLYSGVRGDRQRDIRHRYQLRGVQFEGLHRIMVRALTLNAILSTHVAPELEIDFISIDTEGTELDVLQGLDLSRFRPRVVVIEANSEEIRGCINAHMVQLNGYVEARKLGVNTLYARDRSDADKLKGMQVDCQIEKQVHPLGQDYTIREYIEGRVIREREAAWQTAASSLERIRDRLFARRRR